MKIIAESKETATPGETFYTQPPVSTVSTEEVMPETYDIDQRRRETEILSSIQYLLEPHVPEAYKTEFKKWEVMMSKTLAVSNISRNDVYRFLDYFDVISLWFRFQRPDVAMKRAARMVMELQLNRSVGGFERLSQISTRQTIEQLEKAMDRKKKRGFFGFR